MLALMLYFAASTAKDLVKLFKAPLEAEYPESPLNPSEPTIEPIFTIEDLILYFLQWEKKNLHNFKYWKKIYIKNFL